MQKVDHGFTVKIVVGMLLGMVLGLSIRWLPFSPSVQNTLINDVFQVGGTIFIHIIRMLVVPIVLVSLICGTSSLGDLKKFGRIGGKSLLLYLLTTAIAISLALFFALIFKVGDGMNLTANATTAAQDIPSFRDVLINIFPSNPFNAMSQGIMLQVIVFALLFGAAISALGEAGKKVADFFHQINAVLMKLITMIMRTTPYGVLCLMTVLFAQLGFSAIGHLAWYFLAVVVVLLVQMLGVYALILRYLARLSPVIFFRKMRSALLFAFSVSSSNASIPVVLKTVEKRLGVKNSVASFIVPLGSTINMDGTAIMQGVATIFIAYAYHINIGFTGYLTVIAMSTLASVGTAGVPGVGLITLAMVLQQVGLPVEGVGLILGVDRLLDMLRTAVNVSGDAMIACVVGKSEQALDQAQYQSSAADEEQV
jgi:Na+/H+-dicarboxylate symporter